MKDRRYWYAYSFQFRDKNQTGIASHYTGHVKNVVTLKDIKEAKGATGLPKNAVLMSVSYCGKMTKEEFGINHD